MARLTTGNVKFSKGSARQTAPKAAVCWQIGFNSINDDLVSKAERKFLKPKTTAFTNFKKALPRDDYLLKGSERMRNQLLDWTKE
jgi:hypothetical protein